MLRLLRMVESRAADPTSTPVSWSPAGSVVCWRLRSRRTSARVASTPASRTSVAYTHWMLGDYEQAMVTDLEEIQALRNGALWMLGRREEALQGASVSRRTGPVARTSGI